MINEPDGFVRFISVLTLLATIGGWGVTAWSQKQLTELAAKNAQDLEDYKALRAAELELQKQNREDEQEFRRQVRGDLALKPKLVVVDKGKWEPGDAFHLKIKSESTRPVRIISASYAYTWVGQRPSGQAAAGAAPGNITIEFKQKPRAENPTTFEALVDQVILPTKPDATVVVGIVIPGWAGKQSFDGTLTILYGDPHDPLQLVVDGVRIDAMAKLGKDRGK